MPPASTVTSPSLPAELAMRSWFAPPRLAASTVAPESMVSVPVPSSATRICPEAVSSPEFISRLALVPMPSIRVVPVVKAPAKMLSPLRSSSPAEPGPVIVCAVPLAGPTMRAVSADPGKPVPDEPLCRIQLPESSYA